MDVINVVKDVIVSVVLTGAGLVTVAWLFANLYMVVVED